MNSNQAQPIPPATTPGAEQKSIPELKQDRPPIIKSNKASTSKSQRLMNSPIVRIAVTGVLMMALFALGLIIADVAIRGEQEDIGENEIIPEAEIQLPDASGNSDYTNSDVSDWKTYTSQALGLSFKYPQNWYWENVAGFPASATPENISFFAEGTSADHSGGDHKGNKVFAINIQKDERELEELKNKYHPSATHTTIGGKPAIKTSSNLYIIKPSDDLIIDVVTGRISERSLANQILSTFQFLDNQDNGPDYGFECPDGKVLDCTPCTKDPCPLFLPQYCSKGSAQYNWITENCPDVEIVGLD